MTRMLPALVLTVAIPCLTLADLDIAEAGGEAFETEKARDRLVAGQGGENEAAAIEAWLKGYDAAFLSKDLTRIAAFYHPDVTIYEGGGINIGWADYRDRHLGPELQAFQNLEFAHSGTQVTVHPGGASAYATSRYTIKAKMGDRMLDNEGLETLVLIKTPEGWKIRHSHTSGRPRRPAK